MSATRQQGWVTCNQQAGEPRPASGGRQLHGALGAWEVSLLDRPRALWVATHWGAVAWETGQVHWASQGQRPPHCVGKAAGAEAREQFPLEPDHLISCPGVRLRYQGQVTVLRALPLGVGPYPPFPFSLSRAVLTELFPVGKFSRGIVSFLSGNDFLSFRRRLIHRYPSPTQGVRTKQIPPFP